MAQLRTPEHGRRAGRGHACVPLLRSRGVLVPGGLMLLASVLLLTGHQPHLVAAAPLLLLAACPLMHFFMHHGHSRHGEPHDKGGGS